MDPRGFQALAVAQGLEFYAKHHRMVNSAYTPKNMLAAVFSLTGKKFTGRHYVEAAAHLRQHFGLPEKSL